MKTPMCASENQSGWTRYCDLRRDGLASAEQFPLPHAGEEMQRLVCHRVLEVIKGAGEANDQHALVPRKQFDQREFVRQNQVAEALAVAWKFKGHLVESHAAEIRTAGRRNDGTRVERQALRQSAPTDQRVARPVIRPQGGSQWFERLVAFEGGFQRRHIGGNKLQIQQCDYDRTKNALVL